MATDILAAANERAASWGKDLDSIFMDIEQAQQTRGENMERENERLKIILQKVKALQEDHQRFRKDLVAATRMQSEDNDVVMIMDHESQGANREEGERTPSCEPSQAGVTEKGKEKSSGPVEDQDMGQSFHPAAPSNYDPLAYRQGQSLSIQSLMTSNHDPSNPRSPTAVTIGNANAPNFSAPQWYEDLPVEVPEGAHCNEALRSTLRMLPDLAKRLGNAEPDVRERLIMDLREALHNARFLPLKSRKILKHAEILGPKGLPFIITHNLVPWDLQSDAAELFQLWANEKLDGDLFFGLATSSTLIEGYKSRQFNVFGDNGLRVGQWWPYQICTVRDGAHGYQRQGISGANGTYSIVVAAKSPYNNVDRGNKLLYCGTEGSDGKITPGTQSLIHAKHNRQAVRVIRSQTDTATQKAEHAPEFGFRYDGLYEVKSHVKEPPKTHKFELQRIQGQDPIRGTGPEKRPTRQEKAAFYREKPNLPKAK